MLDQAISTPDRPVHDFDYISDPELKQDCHARYWRLFQEAPSVFWTEANGGHWVVQGARAVTHVLRHPEHFSSRFLSIPPNPDQPKLIPEMLDPPEHRPYRQLLRPFFESKAVAHMEGRVLEWTEKLIGEVEARGECEFVSEISARLPVAVFMEAFGFPLEKYDEFRGITIQFFDAQIDIAKRGELAMAIIGHISELIQTKMANPADDMISKIIASDFEGRKLNFEELMSIGFLMFLAGLDTVTNAMSFGMRHLAQDEELRQKVIDDPSLIPSMVEELLRRYAFISPPRYIVEDVELEGAKLRAGELILALLPTVGWDESLTKNPETVSVEREHYRHGAFGSGVHTCLGLHLARLELITLYKVWFSRIGHFRVAPDADVKTRGGSVMAVERLNLVWDR